MIARLNTAVTTALKDPDIHGKLMKSGATPAATSPAEFGALLKNELARWGKVVRDKGIKPES
jgi:tripartite-type tricarboxylate transporter receptor subunit TctC